MSSEEAVKFSLLAPASSLLTSLYLFKMAVIRYSMVQS